jgi:hypothetical protein
VKQRINPYSPITWDENQFVKQEIEKQQRGGTSRNAVPAAFKGDDGHIPLGDNNKYERN